MEKVYSLLGFAQKAGKLSTGTEAVKSSLASRKAYLLLMSSDIAENSKKALVNISQRVNIPWIIVGNKYDLGTCVGKAHRVAITVNDQKMAQTILGALQGLGEKKETMGVVEWPK